MERRKLIYVLLGSIPILFVLVVLASIHIVYLLLGIIALLAALILLKERRPELFAWIPHRSAGAPGASAGAQPEPARIHMFLVEQSGGARRIEVDRDSFTVGRGADSDCVIDDPGFSRISRQHFRIEYDAGENCCFATDLNSANGTFLNGSRMEPGRRYRLIQGDQIRVDDRSYAVEYAHH